MGAHNYADLQKHYGHQIVMVGYRELLDDEPANLAIECEDCGEVLLDFDKDEPRVLPDNALTLYPALRGHWHDRFPKWDDERDMLVFPKGRPYLTNEWESYPALDNAGVEVWVRVRQADCGAGCRCAGEYRLH